jgi:hypothetical protein
MNNSTTPHCGELGFESLYITVTVELGLEVSPP